SKSALSADLGILYRLTPRQTLGLSVQDLNEPDVALSSNDEDRVPRTIRLGWAYEKPKGLSFTTALTTRQNIPGHQDYKAAGAVEKWWNTSGVGDWAARGAFV